MSQLCGKPAWKKLILRDEFWKGSPGDRMVTQLYACGRAAPKSTSA
jgi:hypothetical protein